ncbi:hypothetical protein [Roseburia sp. 499]|uniref:hypothetical protein n=1 Tax=Roseburia sp. 499 TaxID=1261634 RepID=UPI0009524FC3|nr:hypothetical protein [Roseburia sp. 499]WVK69299.1 hypothetical protein BIV20_13175 [Roseburia sp. 499]
MLIRDRRIAIFINTQNIMEPEKVLAECRKFETVAEIFVGNQSSESLHNLGIDISANFYDYDYVVMINPFKESTREAQSVRLQRQTYYLKSVLKNISYLEREIDILEQSRYEGMLVPVIDYVKVCNGEDYLGWEDYYTKVVKAVGENQLNVSTDERKAPIISEGGCAIIRTSAIRGFEELKCEEFDSQFICYLLSLYIQSQGYLPGYCMEHEMVANNILGYGAVMPNKVQYFQPIMKLKCEVYYDIGKGFDVSKVYTIEYILKIGKKEKIEFEIEIPKGCKYIRFDPCEKFMCVCSEIKTDLDGVKIHNINGIHFGKEDLFLTKDPQYILEGDFSNIEKLTITIDYMSIFWSENGLKDEMDKIFQEKGELANAVHHLTYAYQEQEEEKKQKEQDVQNVREELRSKKEELENTEEELKNIKEELQSTKEEVQNKIINLENELQEIKGSRSWKLLSKYRSIKARVLRK